MSLHYYRKHRQVNSVSKKISILCPSLYYLSIVCGGFSLWDYARYIPDATWQAELYSLQDVPSMSLAKVPYSC